MIRQSYRETDPFDLDIRLTPPTMGTASRYREPQAGSGSCTCNFTCPDTCGGTCSPPSCGGTCEASVCVCPTDGCSGIICF